MAGYIILSLTILCFISVGIWLLIKTFKKPKLPEGYRFETTFANNKAIIIIDNNIPAYGLDNQIEGFIVDNIHYPIKKLLNYCVISIAATEAAFKDKNIKTDIKEIVYIFQPNDVFQKTWNAQWPSNISVGAYTIQLKSMFNVKKTYVAYIRSKFMKNISEIGYPVIHENIHILNNEAGLGYNKPHDDKKLWARHGENTVETIAINYWKNYLVK